MNRNSVDSSDRSLAAAVGGGGLLLTMSARLGAGTRGVGSGSMIATHGSGVAWGTQMGVGSAICSASAAASGDSLQVRAVDQSV